MSTPSSNQPLRQWRAFVDVIEELLSECKEDGRLAKFDDFYKEFPYHREIQYGRRGVKDRSEVMQMAKSLQCTPEERNRILVVAGYAPVEEYIKDENQLKIIMETAQTILDYLPFPAYAITRDDIIHRWNHLCTVMFNISDERLRETPDDDRNVLRFIFDPGTPVYHLLTNNSKTWTWWWYTARLNVFRFKKYNVLCQNDKWYQDRRDSLMQIPGFETVWAEIKEDTPPEEFSKDLPTEMPFTEYVTVIFSPDGQEIKVRGLQIDFLNKEFPRIVAFIPDNEDTNKIFTEYGIPTPNNRWGYLQKNTD